MQLQQMLGAVCVRACSASLSLPSTSMDAHPVPSHSPASSPVGGLRAPLRPRSPLAGGEPMASASGTGMGLPSSASASATLVTLPITPRAARSLAPALQHCDPFFASSSMDAATAAGISGAGPAGRLVPAASPPALPAVALPDGALYVVAYMPGPGSVRYGGDMPAWWRGGVAEVWQGIQLARSRFAAHNVAVAPPPKHSR